MGDWIRCEERLPDVNEKVAAWSPKEGYAGPIELTDSGNGPRWIKRSISPEYDLLWELHEFTHWAPLLEPPKEINDE